MGGKAQTRVAGFGVKLAKNIGPSLAFVASDPDTDDRGMLRAHLRGFAKDARGGLLAEVAYSVEDPVRRNAEVHFGSVARPFQAFKERFKFAPAPVVNNSYRDVDLSMDHALRGQPLQHAPRDELVVFLRSQPLGHCLEGHQEAREIRVLIDGKRLVE